MNREENKEISRDLISQLHNTVLAGTWRKAWQYLLCVLASESAANFNGSSAKTGKTLAQLTFQQYPMWLDRLMNPKSQVTILFACAYAAAQRVFPSFKSSDSEIFQNFENMICHVAARARVGGPGFG